MVIKEHKFLYMPNMVYDVHLCPCCLELSISVVLSFMFSSLCGMPYGDHEIWHQYSDVSYNVVNIRRKKK